MRALFVAVILVIAAGCAGSTGPDQVGPSVGRDVPAGGAASLAMARFEAALARLRAEPAVHADVALDDGVSVRVELDTGSGRWRAEGYGGEIALAGADDRLRRALELAVLGDSLDDLLDGAAEESLDARVGRYGFEDGYRVAGPGVDTIEFWISHSTAMVTELTLPRDGVVVRFTPLPAPLQIDQAA